MRLIILLSALMVFGCSQTVEQYEFSGHKRVSYLDKNSYFRYQFCPRFINSTTEEAYYDFFVKQDIKIDFLIGSKNNLNLKTFTILNALSLG